MDRGRNSYPPVQRLPVPSRLRQPPRLSRRRTRRTRRRRRGSRLIVHERRLLHRSRRSLFSQLFCFGPKPESELPAAFANTAVQAQKRSEEHTSGLQSRPHLVCRLLLEKKKKQQFARWPEPKQTTPVRSGKNEICP